MTTVLSRITGLIRDVVFFAAIGANAFSSAFIIGFTIPNLFRRLFGEGALSSAFIPVFSSLSEKFSRASALSFFLHFIIRWSLYLTVIALLVTGLLQLAMLWEFIPNRWILPVKIFQILMPYMVFICMAAIVSGALNVFGRFLSASFAPVLFNVVFILALLLGIRFSEAESNILLWLCAAVLLGGLMQLLLPSYDLYRQRTLRGCPFERIGARMEVLEEELGTDDREAAFKSFWSLFVPSLLGAALMQINILVSRLLAHSLDDTSVSFLYVSSRLMELPLGIFTIAIITVFFPEMSRAFAEHSRSVFFQIAQRGMHCIMLIVLPATLGLCLLSKEILMVLFQWGQFNSGDVHATAPIVIIYALSLPFHSIATFCVRCFYSAKSMHLPVRIALVLLLLNTVLSLIFMTMWGVYGLAAANLITAIIHALMLLSATHKTFSIEFMRGLKPILNPILCGLIAIVIICVSGKFALAHFNLSEKLSAIVAVSLLIPLSASSYFFILHRLGISNQRLWGLFKQSQ